MWLIVALVAALIASAAYLWRPAERKKYKLGFLTLMLWGTAIMVFTDHSIAYLQGEPFIEAATGGLVADSVLLGIAMVAAVLIVWAAAVALQARKPSQA